ncbi:MAG: hypothetical protein N2508_10585, partial [Anaerolineae bacterium]|nr:hypothetical protein [Anaerolineae bacterium]
MCVRTCRDAGGRSDVTPLRRTYVKICGITRLDDARCATEAGADFLGFVFYPLSPRFVTLAQAATITRRLRQEFGASAPRCVGVF